MIKDFIKAASLVSLVMVLVFTLIGCSTTVPVTAKFPDKPKDSGPCQELKKLDDGAKLSDVSKTINSNYSSSHECSVKNDTWIEWYEIQKRIFEGVAK